MKKYTTKRAEHLALEYKARFGFQLKNRVRVLIHRHPNVLPPNFLSWEGEKLTGADTTEKLKDLLRVCPWV